MLNLGECVLRTVEYLRSNVLDEDKTVTFGSIQTHFLNGNRLLGEVNKILLDKNLTREEREQIIDRLCEGLPTVDQLMPWIIPGGNEEQMLYKKVKELGTAYTKLGIRLFEDYWSRFDVSTLTFRQREGLGKRMLASRYDWLLRTLPKNSKIEFFAEGPDRGYIYITERPKMLVKVSVSDQEPEISMRAGEIGVGPEVYEGNEDYIAEELINTSTDLTTELLDSPRMLGQTVGYLLRALHQSGIIYSDVIFSISPRQVHLLHDGSRAYLIDYGGSKWGDDTDFDIRKFIVSLENIAKFGRSSHRFSSYVNTGLSSFGRVYGRNIKRADYPEVISQFFT